MAFRVLRQLGVAAAASAAVMWAPAAMAAPGNKERCEIAREWVQDRCPGSKRCQRAREWIKDNCSAREYRSAAKRTYSKKVAKPVVRYVVRREVRVVRVPGPVVYGYVARPYERVYVEPQVRGVIYYYDAPLRRYRPTPEYGNPDVYETGSTRWWREMDRVSPGSN